MSTENSEATCYLRRRAAGEYLKQKFGFGAGATLAKIACISSEGPPFRKAGRMALYAIEDLDRWALAKIGQPQKSTSDKVWRKLNFATRPPSARRSLNCFASRYLRTLARPDFSSIPRNFDARDDAGMRHSIHMGALHFKAAVTSANELSSVKEAG